MALRTFTFLFQRPRLAYLTALGASLAFLSAAGPARALVSSCQPQANGPGTVPAGTVIAPGLRVIKSVYQLGTCDSTITPAAESPDGTVWGVDQGNSKNGLWKSTDDLSTWQLVTTFPDYVSVQEVLPLASGHLLVVVRDSDNVHYVLRSTDTSGQSWAPPSLTMPAGAYVHDPQSWFQASDGTIWVPQYQGPSPMNLWKSTDDGQTFSVAYSASAEEFHSVEPDPYVPGRIWLCVDGDGSELSIGYSDDAGSSWTWVSQTSYPQARALDLMFTPSAVYWADDAPELPGALYRWDRTSNQVTTVLSGLNAPFMNTFSFNGVYAQFSSVDAAADGYIGDEYIHVLTSTDPSTTWTETKTPLMRTSGTSDKYALMTDMTLPDSQGRFWAGFYDIGNAEFFDAAIELQLDPTAAYNGITAAFNATPASPAPNQTITFDGSASNSSNPPLSYSWDFGDGSTGSGSVVTHSYATAGKYPVKLQVSDANSDVTELTQVVTVATSAPAAPVVTTNPASGISFDTATLNASVNPSGAATTVHFDWGRTTAYGSQTASQDVGAATSSQPLSAVLTGLSPNTTYHYRISASNAGGSSNGQDATFTTGPAPPVVTTNPASGISVNTATLNASVNPSGAATTAHFDWGTTTAYGSQTASQDVGAATSSQPLSAVLTGLSPNTTYHYRVSASNAGGSSNGQDATFTTGPAPPVVTTNPASSISFDTATLNASVNPSGSDTTVHFDWGRSTAYGSQTASQGVGAGRSSQPYSAVLSGLSPNTTYHYRISASNAAGSANGQDATFKTGPLPPVATTGAATAITNKNAQLNGTVNPGGGPTTFYFQYGTTTSYTSQTGTASAGSGTTPKVVSAKANGLQRATTYHMRLVATNASGTSFGQDVTFSTTS